MNNSFKKQTSNFINGVYNNIAIALYNELNIRPNVDYIPSAHNGKRLGNITLSKFPPRAIKQLLKMQSDITIYAGLPDSMPVRISWGANRQVFIEFPKPKHLRQNITLDDLEFTDNAYTVPLGLNTRDKQIDLNFSEAIVTHVMLSGQTQSGKTKALQYLTWGLCRDHNPKTGLVLFDVAKEGENFSMYGNHPNLICPVATEADTCKVAIGVIEKLMSDKNRTYDKTFIIVDELKWLLKRFPESNEIITEITEVGAQFGLHVIAATQYPYVKLLGDSSGMVGNLTTRICGKVLNAAASSNALGLPDMGAEKLTGFGDFIIVNHDPSARFLFPFFDETSQLPNFQDRDFDLSDYEITESDNDGSFVNKGPGRPVRKFDHDTELKMRSIAMAKPDFSIRGFIKAVYHETGEKIGKERAKGYLADAKQIKLNLVRFGLRELRLREPK